MPPLDDDSDEEWSRIADAVNDFEAQYVAARNAALQSQTSPGSILKGNVFAPPEATAALPPLHFDGPPRRSGCAIDALPPLPASSVTHPAYGTSAIIQSGAPLALRDSPDKVVNVAEVASGPIDSTSVVGGVHVPVTDDRAKVDTTTVDPASNATPKTVDVNSYSLALAEKEEEVRGLKQQLSGVQSNFRNKIQVLQSELLQTRRSSTTPGTGSSSLPATTANTTVTPPISAIAPVNHVEELQREAHRLRHEVEQARAESRAHSESLAFTQQELAEVRDRERKLLAALRAAPAPFDSPQPATMPLINPTSPVLPPVVPALTQPGDVVEGTQAAAVVATQGPSQMLGQTRTQVQVQSQTPVGAATRPLSQAGRSQQPFKMYAAMRPVSRKRRRPSTARSVNEDAPDALMRKKPFPVDIQADDKREDGARVDGVSTDHIDSKDNIDRAPEDQSLKQHGWGFDFNSDTWSENALRRRLFEGRLGEELLSLATIEHKELGSGILAAIGNDTRWSDVIPPLARILAVAPRATWSTLRIARVILTYSVSARTATALSAEVEDNFVTSTIQVFDSATSRQDARIACFCMQILNAIVDGVADISDPIAADTAAASVSKTVLASDSSILWASGARSAKQGETTVDDGAHHENEENDDADTCVANSKSPRTNALCLLDAVTALALATNSRVPDSVWAAVERAYGEAADVLCSGGDDARVETAMGMMSRAAVHAPYLINDFGGADGLCSTCTRAVRWLQRTAVERVQDDFSDVEGVDICGAAERTHAMGIVCACVNILLLAAAGMGNKLDVSPSMRLIGLSTLAVLAWPRKGLGATPPEFECDSRFQEECRKVWSILGGRDRIRKASASSSHDKSAVD